MSDRALDFTAPFRLCVTAGGKLRCFVLHFDTIFDCTAAGGERTAFTTSCLGTPTHWKQSTLHLAEPVQLAVGDVVSGEITFSRGAEYKRAYNITVGWTVAEKLKLLTKTAAPWRGLL